jgi:hypothetical protein
MSRPVDFALVEAFGSLLLMRHVGEEHAATWEVLRAELEHFGFSVGAVRRLQEAAEVLVDREPPLAVVGLSSSGVFVANTVDEIDRALLETERRARKTLTRRRRLRRVRMAMLGQRDLEEQAA